MAVLRELDLNPDIVNVNGGAIALGHPLGCTAQNFLYNSLTKCVEENNAMAW